MLNRRLRHLPPTAAALWFAGLVACTVSPLDLDGRPCDDQGCLKEYVCHPELGLCVPPITVDCESSTAFCPDRISTNDPCPSVNSYIPCNNAGTECCRTCGADLRWGMCTARACSPGSVEICDNLDNNCNDLIDEGIFACRCSYAQSTAELCNGIDDDCNDGIDDIFACELGELRDCDAGAGPTSGTQACSTSCAWTSSCLAKDQVAPGRILNLAAVPGHRSLSLSWRYPGDSDLSLCVLQRSEAGFPAHAEQGVRAYSELTPTANASANHLDHGLVNTVTYYYAGFCRDTSGNWNTEVVPNDNATSGTPTAGIPANPTDFAATDAQDRSTTLTFTMPPEPVVRCNVRRRDDGRYPTSHDDTGSFSVATVLAPQSDSVNLLDTGLFNDATYHYAVFCNNDERWNDTVSTNTGSQNADTAVPRDPLPNNPTNLTAFAGDASVTLDFTMPTTTLTRCELHRSRGSYPTTPATETLAETFTSTGDRSFLDAGLENGTAYAYVVFCLNGTRWNDAVIPGSNATTATPVDVPLQRQPSLNASVTNNTTLNVGTIPAATNVLLIAAIAARPNTAVAEITGGELTWRLIDAQCGGAGGTRLELWSAFGSPANAFQARIVMAESSDLVAVITPYLGANPATPLGNRGARNANGVDGACTGGDLQSSWAVDVTRGAGAWAHAAVNLHNAADQSHTPSADIDELEERHTGTGNNAVGIAVVGTTHTTAALGGNTGITSIDWAAVGVEILP